MLEESNFSEIVCRELALENIAGDMSEWEAMTERIRNSDKEVKIALVGKYVQLHDAYLSVGSAETRRMGKRRQCKYRMDRFRRRQ